MNNIAIFASGSGTNAENIIRHFADSPLARVTLVVSDNPNAGALQRADNLSVERVIVPRAEFRDGSAVLDLLDRKQVDYIVLAGFLCLVPEAIVKGYRGRIINIHPALLPAYGGKGMYGDRVHAAVIANGEKESGITIHAVNEQYDEGDVIVQYRVKVASEDTPESLATKIHALEYEYFPAVIEGQIRKIDKKD